VPKGKGFQNPNEDASYPRVIRLQPSGSANGTLLATFSHSGYNNQPSSFPIYQSTDGGQTWSSSPISVQTMKILFRAGSAASNAF
jgi:hypothetical protein